jgi:GNAT superfamily N-acetyltransferase
MELQVRHALMEDAPRISKLVQAGFVERIASDWESSAQQHFMAETEADKLAPKIAASALCLVCECDARLLGVVLLPRPTTVQLFFVASAHLGTGIGRTLWNAVRVQLAEKHPEVRTVELNSSPYALRAYKALGFFPISKPYRYKGAVATRMACWLPGKAFEEEQHVA